MARRRRHGCQMTRGAKPQIGPILGIFTNKQCACSMIAFSTTPSVGGDSGCLDDLRHLIKVLTRPPYHEETRILIQSTDTWSQLGYFSSREITSRSKSKREVVSAHPRIFQSDEHFTSMSGVPGKATNRSGGHALSQGVTRVCFLKKYSKVGFGANTSTQHSCNSISVGVSKIQDTP